LPGAQCLLELSPGFIANLPASGTTSPSMRWWPTLAKCLNLGSSPAATVGAVFIDPGVRGRKQSILGIIVRWPAEWRWRRFALELERFNAFANRRRRLPWGACEPGGRCPDANKNSKRVACKALGLASSIMLAPVAWL
jgi:hypothetical protein